MSHSDQDIVYLTPDEQEHLPNAKEPLMRSLAEQITVVEVKKGYEALDISQDSLSPAVHQSNLRWTYSTIVFDLEDSVSPEVNTMVNNAKIGQHPITDGFLAQATASPAARFVEYRPGLRNKLYSLAWGTASDKSTTDMSRFTGRREMNYSTPTYFSHVTLNRITDTIDRTGTEQDKKLVQDALEEASRSYRALPQDKYPVEPYFILCNTIDLPLPLLVKNGSKDVRINVHAVSILKSNAYE
ncbi:uncharacterized protein I303_108200 [Kwoniella dejecticola CBS 10117]|uniref:Uncharacterized protein n=1 Tax=Kwoniella dejecticola CBS 10117 TaxID=1296121 RepID=A0A1A5ZY20_9TREE|nr:uncharacterized protein I303_07474 [Kwoniella dejecticola CBS 10117]OBR82707.1 hypothetical protein I303_07474 [Kwoniella dejecticola CBS 10117]